MESLVITCPGQEPFTYVNELPPDLSASRLPLTEIITGLSKAGRMCFQYATHDDVAMYHSVYLPVRDIVLKAEQNSGVCELHVCMLNHFDSEWDGIGQPTQLPMQFNLS